MSTSVFAPSDLLALPPGATVAPAGAAAHAVPAVQAVQAAQAMLPGVFGGTPVSPQMWRCLLLAALLHLWLVLLLGNAPGGTAQLGAGSWGAINVTLRGPQNPGATDLQVPPEPLPPSGPAGTALSPRFGGAVREAGPAPAPEPGAAQVGNWTATPLPLRPDSSLPTAASPTPRVDASQASSGPPPTQGRVTEPRATELPATTPGPLPVPAPPPVPMPAAEPAPTPVLERSLPSTIDRNGTRAATVQPLAPDAPNTTTLRAPNVATSLPDLAAPLPPLPAPPSATVVAPTPAVGQADASPAPALAAPAAPVLRSLGTAPTGNALAGVAPMQADTPGVTAPNVLTPTLPALVRAVPALPAVPAPIPTGPDAGPRVGSDVATPASQPASTPRLNLQLARPRGTELSRGSSTGVLQLLPRPPEVASKLSKDIEKAGRADCKTAYGGGLLAVLPLVVDAVRQDGCKW